jgi:hypothetical protein
LYVKQPLFIEVQAAGTASAYEEAWSGGGCFAGRAPDSPLRNEAERIAPHAPVGELLGVELAVAARRPPRRGSGEWDPDRSPRLRGGNGRRGASAFPGSRSGRRGARRAAQRPFGALNLAKRSSRLLRVGRVSHPAVDRGESKELLRIVLTIDRLCACASASPSGTARSPSCARRSQRAAHGARGAGACAAGVARSPQAGSAPRAEVPSPTCETAARGRKVSGDRSERALPRFYGAARRAQPARRPPKNFAAEKGA